MIHAWVELEVDDFAAFWEEFQTRDYERRRMAGSLGAEVFCHSEDPRRVNVLFLWESRQRMQRFFGQAVEPLHARQLHSGAPRFLRKAGELDA